MGEVNNKTLEHSESGINDGKTSAYMKVGVFVLLATILFFVTDSLELKLSNQGEFKNGLVQKKTNKTMAVTTLARESEKDLDQQSPRHKFSRRGKPTSEDAQSEISLNWGTWNWEDEPDRPTADFYQQYPNRDVPLEKFPDNAWQKDPAYVARYLQESNDLVIRAMEAILAEYGHGAGVLAASFEERSTMFRISMLPDEEFKDHHFDKNSKGGDEGGWSTPRGWEGLKRRLLHSLMTEDTFVFAMGGHSASAGHGNHFQQAYTSQVQLVLEPIFARLGVKHEARNFGNGGMGTVHNGIGAASIYGPDVSFLLWDCSMTEKGDYAAGETFAKQAILGGIKVPVIWGLETPVLQTLHGVDVDIGYLGNYASGLTKAKSIEDLDKLPFAARYLKCSNEIEKALCKPHRYNGTCWIDRPDFNPSAKQKTHPGGRAGWHPGDHEHRLKGRGIAFVILKALHEGLTLWSEAGGQILPDDAWHVTSQYEKTRSRVRALEPAESHCKKYVDMGLGFLCKYPFKSRTEFTPRSHPSLTNIRSLMPPEMKANINPAQEGVYDPPDVFIPHLHPPDGALDIVNIVESGPAFKSVMAPSYLHFYDAVPIIPASSIQPGKGIELRTKAQDYNCDGMIDSFCGRDSSNNCLLQGQHDGRNGLKFDSLSGWTKLNLPKVEYGYIVLKIESWHDSGSVGKTEGWASENGERKLRETKTPQNETQRSSRRLSPPYCDNFRFEYAIEGNITSVEQGEFLEDYKIKIQRVVEVFPILRDPNYTGGKKKDIEIAFRIHGCGREKTFKLTHIYWA